MTQLDNDKKALELAAKAARFLKHGEVDKVIHLLNEAIDLGPNLVWILYGARGLAWSDKGEFDKAIADYDEAIRLKPDDAEVYYNRGNAWHDKGEDDKAIADFNEAIRLKPDYADVYNNRGNVWSSKGEVDKAFADYDEAIRLKPDDADVYNNRGSAWSNKGEVDKAIADFDEAIKLQPENAEAYYNRGNAWRGKGEFDKAIADYNEAIRLKPDLAQAYRNRGAAWVEKGEVDKAIADFDEAIRLKPDDADAYHNRGSEWGNKGEFDNAIADFNEAIRLKPDDADAYYNRGTAWHNKGEVDKAVADYDEAIRLKPDNAYAYHNRGLAYYQLKEYEEAIANFDYAIRLNPDLALSHKFRKLAYDELNKMPEHLKEPEEEKYTYASPSTSSEQRKESKPKTIKAAHPRGLEEYSERQWRERQKMLRAVEEVLEQRGFMPLETAMLEYDHIIKGFIPPKEVFSLKGKDNIALRYDLTAPLARYVAEHFDELPKPFRRYQKGWVFRNDKPDQGRFKQFMQIDADTIGSDNPAADAEMIMTLCDCLGAIGLERGQYDIRINHRKILERVFSKLGAIPISPASLMRTLDKHDRLGYDAVAALLGEGRRDQSGDFTKGAGLEQTQINTLLKFLQLSAEGTRLEVCAKIEKHFGENEGVNELRQMDALFTKLGYDEAQIRFDTSIVRGLDYYTGVVFEANYGTLGSIGGGGRYDDLLKRFRGESIPSVGMSVGISRLHAMLEKDRPSAETHSAETHNLIVVLAMEPDRMVEYQKLAAALRKDGLRAEVYIGSGGMRQQLKYADKRNARLAIIQGEDERNKNQITIKDLTLGSQRAGEISDNRDWRSGGLAQTTIAAADLVAKCRALLQS